MSTRIFVNILKLLLKVATLSFVLLATAAQAATYYIDYVDGSDGNDGTAKTTPWKRHPFMAGWSGHYSHAAGDRFIFKGGRTWPRACFQMKITAGGSSDTSRDYYGVDQTWFTNESFVKPKFDFEHILIGGGAGTVGSGFMVENANFITIDYLDFANHRSGLDTPSTTAYGSCTIALVGTSQNITIKNCHIRDWDIPTIVSPNFDGGSGGGVFLFAWGGGGPGISILNNTITQSGVSVRSGRALSLWGEIGGNDIYEVSIGLLGAGYIHDNHIHHIRDATDAELHENAIYTTGPSTIANNVINDLAASVMPILCEPGRSGSSGDTTLVYNNVVYNGSTGGSANGCLTIEAGEQYAPITGVKAYNNTFEHGSGTCVRVIPRAGVRLGLIDLRNNHYITSGTPRDIPSSAYITLIESNNVTQTGVAAAESGATTSNNYRPTSERAPTIRAGINFSSSFTTDIDGSPRRSGSEWDAGAYEFAGIAATPTPPKRPVAPHLRIER
jgi:hypothetical protein